MSDLDDIIDVGDVSITDRSPTAATFGVPLLVGYHTAWVARVREYAEAADMLVDGFTTASPLYKMAVALKSQNPAPKTFKVGRLALPYTQVVNLVPQNLTQGFLYNWSVADTALTYTVLGSATLQILVEAFKPLIDALATVVATEDDVKVVCTASAAGVLNQFSWDRNIKIQDVTPDPGIATDLAAILLEDPNWYGFVIDCNSKPIVLQAALWAESAKKIFVPMTGDADVVDGAETTVNMFSALKALSYVRSPPIWHRFIAGTEWINAAWLATILAPDPGASTAAFKTLAGITADDLRTSELSAIAAKNGTWYRTKHGLAITFEGKTPGGRFIDITRFVDWQLETIQVDVFSVLYNQSQARKVPYDAAGISMVKGAVEGAILKGQKAGGVAINPAPEITAPEIADTTTADRAARILRSIVFRFRLAGALHRVVVKGTISV
jgi:hypothetical protein